jgi:hypothetical protein
MNKGHKQRTECKEKAEKEMSAFLLYANANHMLDAHGLQLALSAIGVEKSEQDATLLCSAAPGSAVDWKGFQKLVKARKIHEDPLFPKMDLFDD